MEKKKPQALPYLESMNVIRDGVSRTGYSESFIYGNHGYTSLSDTKTYQPDEIRVISLMRFQGNDHSEPQVELHIIETHDGKKGIVERACDYRT